MEEASCRSPRAASSCRELHSGPGAGVSSTVDGGRRGHSLDFESLKEYVGHRVYKTECFAEKTAKQEKTQSHPLEPLPYHPSAARSPCHWAGGMAGKLV